MFVRKIYVIRSVNYFYVRQNELNPWVRKHNGIKFYAIILNYLVSFNMCLCCFSQENYVHQTKQFLFIYMYNYWYNNQAPSPSTCPPSLATQSIVRLCISRTARLMNAGCSRKALKRYFQYILIYTKIF